MIGTSRLLAAITLIALPFPTLSAETGSEVPTSKSAQLETITVTASRRERPLREVANSISIISAETIQDTLAADIKDLARHTPWLSVQNDPSRFGLSGFSIRGLGANRVATEIDGIPVANSFSVGNYSNGGRNAINPAMVKRVEILRGPASALYGSDAMGGVVSYQTFEPSDFLLGSDSSYHFGTTTGYDARDNSLTGSFTAAQDVGSLSLLLAATSRFGHAMDNRAFTAGGRPNPRDYDQTDFSGKLIRETAAGAVTLALDGRRTRAVTEVNNLEGQGRFASTTALRGDDRFRRDRVSLSGRTAMNSALISDLDWSVYFQQSVTDQRSSEERAGSSRSPSPTLRFPRFIFEERVLGASVNAARDVSFGEQVHRLLFGLQMDQRTIDESRDNRLVNLDSGESTNVVLGETFPVRDFPVSRIFEAAIFAHDEIVLANGRLTLIPGLRAEYYDLSPRPDAVYTEDNPSAAPVAISELSFSPKLGAVLQLGEDVTVFGQYANGFRSPPFEDANIGLEIPLFNVRAIPNPDLQPETSHGLELGMRLARGDFRGSISVYRNRYRDFIDTKVNLGPDPQTGVLIFQSLNRDRAEIEGVEADFAYDLGAIARGFELTGNLAGTRGVDSVRNLPLNSIDPRRANLGLRYDDPGQRWGAQVLASFAAAKTRVDESSLELFQPAGYGIVDLHAYYQLTKKSRLDFALFNLGNRRYWDWADVGGRPADDPLIDLYTRPGVNFAANLRVNW